MLVTRRQSYKHHVFEAVLVICGLLFFCEYLIYYIVLFQVSYLKKKHLKSNYEFHVLCTNLIFCCGLLLQCDWPHLDPRKADPTIPKDIPDETPVRAMFFADTHLLGPRKGHWFDKLRRY